MAKTVSVLNQKGGVGKTTTAVNLAACIGDADKKVLLVDIDPQGNTTSGFGIDKRKIKSSSYDLFTSNATAEEVTIHTEFKNTDIIPAHMDLAGAELEIIDFPDREKLLKNALAPIWDKYDFIFLDCPPSLGLITLNALTASDTVLVPIQCEYYALEGLSQLMSTVRQIKRRYNPYIELEGVLLTMFDGRTNFSMQVAEEVRRHFPGKVFASVIPRNVRLAEAPSHGLPVTAYDRFSRGAVAYRNLAEEILRRKL